MAEILHLEGDILEIKGATRVVSSTQTQAVVETADRAILIAGNGIEVKKLNLDEGEVSFFGKFLSIKFAQSHGKKQPLLKRIFK